MTLTQFNTDEVAHFTQSLFICNIFNPEIDSIHGK